MFVFLHSYIKRGMFTVSFPLRTAVTTYIEGEPTFQIPYNYKFFKAELNPICYLLALLAHHFLHVSRIGLKSLTLRLLMSYIYIYIDIYIYI